MGTRKLTRRRLAALAAGLPALAGCATIPVLPDIATAPRERLALLAEVLDGAPVLDGNRVEVLSGGGALAAVLRAVEAARDHVHLEFYTMEDVRLPGRAGPGLFDLLAAKLREGIAVTLIYDSFGSAETPAADFEALRLAGARVVSFNPLNPLEARGRWLPNRRDHRKIMVVDGRVALVGGVNLDRVYENSCRDPAETDDPEQACWLDTALLIEGPAVGALQRLFLDTWARQGGGPLQQRDWFPPLAPRGEVRVQILGSTPGQQMPRFYVALLTAIQAAQRSLWLATGYFVPTGQQLRALQEAARRGVQVRLLLSGLTDVPLALAAQRRIYGELLRAGIEIHEVRRAVLHAKLAVVDGAWCAVGSSNFDRRSIAWNHEVDAVVLDQGIAGRLEATLRRAWNRAEPVTLAGWESRGAEQRLHEQLSRLVIDLL